MLYEKKINETDNSNTDSENFERAFAKKKNILFVIIVTEEQFFQWVSDFQIFVGDC